MPRRKQQRVECVRGVLGHDFTETMYATASGRLLIRKTCRHCLLTKKIRIRYITDPRDR